MNMDFFTILGQITAIVLVILIALIVITLILGLYFKKKKKLLFPGLLLFTLNLTYPLIKKLFKLFQLNDLLIDAISIDLRNRINHDNFIKLDARDVIMVLPHCLRAPDCPAKLGESGLECICCGNCSIGIIYSISQRKAIDMYIVPGSTFIKNVLRKRSFKGVIGVACPVDLNLAMMSLDDFCVQGVYLLRDGCINTLVDVDEVIELINSTKPYTDYKKEDFIQ
ncbi:MAG: DUF116 domain-containing protein [Methanosphaera stadtmanae]|jgi:hypothetical protein|nr:DUF116 domain-containing protein [Methanosphaera stadtmanae]